MTTLELEVSVKGSRSKVFETLTDFENFQKQSPLFFPHLQVKSKRGNVCVIEQHLVLAKKEFVMMTKHIVNYPATHEYFVIGGDCKG
ncbi:MAG: polyketide cyclase, partial [Nitrosopumilaceae archaeon]|nr:polyketide cyclase [Nitrosopumilaceae archaeon]NIU87055.1 polyketide cyclase [Nitrosopumilaceae archaeon]NIV65626.1 polyketide cyclase [Nitrosopumilaceae archaeon]NIX61601.1 polyketide cyclase [Nitrosopumilaceae archaeon]